MPDILIRGVPEDVVHAIDAKAHRAGLSRTEYLRRTLTRNAADLRASLKRSPLGSMPVEYLTPQIDEDFELTATVTEQPVERLVLA